MATLEKSLRNQLERTIGDARDVAEAAAKAALEQLGVGDASPPSHLSEKERNLRRRLRIHGRQLGDQTDDKKKTQQIDRLIEEVAYEHWHRMLFARFLAENNLLMYPDPHQPVAISLQECDDLAADEGARNGWELAARFAAGMLPEIFRVDSPVFEIELPPEHQQQLEKFVGALPTNVFAASDSLGWVYQFWQARRKDQVNASELKIGARELPAVTQLFTEDYMVDFLLDNTLGAWHAGKILAKEPELFETAKSEDELRSALALPVCPWSYLRFIKSESGRWSPAAGSFEGWPKTASELKCLDPCMGSGHFVVAMFERLVALRVAEEKLDDAEVVSAVIRDNLYGLEIDPRCTQIAAFNLALAAWRRVGYRTLPPMNLACSGLAPNTSEDEWLKLAGGDEKLRNGMARLHQLFQNAPVLGSLINPAIGGGDLLEAGFQELQPLLERMLAHETKDDTRDEMAVTARGLAKAAEILASQFTLVATNPPYLKRGKQCSEMRTYTEKYCEDASADAATSFMQRCVELCASNGATALVLPQNWLFLNAYRQFRTRWLKTVSWRWVARLGARSFQTPMYDFNIMLGVFVAQVPCSDFEFSAIDADSVADANGKATIIENGNFSTECQSRQLSNDNCRVVFGGDEHLQLLKEFAETAKGVCTYDSPKFLTFFWESVRMLQPFHIPCHSTVEKTSMFSGMHSLLQWENGEGELADLMSEKGTFSSGVWKAWVRYVGKSGICVSQMGSLPCSLYTGFSFDNNVGLIVPSDIGELAAIWCFCSSPEFNAEARKIDQSLKITNAPMIAVPFDIQKWGDIAHRYYPNGLPQPFSDDPTQWIFHGHPCGSVIWDEKQKWTAHGSLRTDNTVLQVAMVRLLGYRWPAELESSLDLADEQREWVKRCDDLTTHADNDSIVCIPPVRGETGAADRLLNLLASAYGKSWSSDVLTKLLKEVGFEGKGLEAWLRDGFFQQHCELFHQRPFIWQIWDGLRDGFSALVNYHKLDRKNLETLIYTYLGDWMTRQSQDVANGIDGAQEKLSAAEQLKKRLELIVAGEAPHDIFVRWKPLHQQPIGWEPDLNDGVRMNIRPFLSVPDIKAKGAGVLRVKPKIKWEKDRGKEPQRSKEDFPWFWGWDGKSVDFAGGPEFKGERFNDCHYTLARKKQARERAPGK